MTHPVAWLLLAICSAVAIWSFYWIIRWYRRPYGFPWILSLLFAAAAVGAIFALHALIGR